MAIEFKHNGRLWRADTVDEAVALREKLEAHDQAEYEAGEELPYESGHQVWTPDIMEELLKNAGSLQSRFLRVLSEDRIKSEDLVLRLGLDSEIALAGVLSGLSKQLKKLGVKPSDVYRVDVSWKGKNKTRYFMLASGFEWAAMELGWPEKWPS